MSDFLKKMKSLFIVEEPGVPGQEINTSDQGGSQQQNSNTPAANTPLPTPSSGEVSDKFMEVLFSAMQQNNLDGFDYLEYKQSLQSLSKMQMDEQTRFQSAFAMAQTMGVTVPKLLDSASHYIQILQQENQKFNDALSKQRSQQIGNREEQITQLDKAIQSKTEQIQSLTQEIEQNRKQMEQLKQEIAQSTVKVESTKNDFLATYTNLVNQINTDISNIKTFLK